MEYQEKVLAYCIDCLLCTAIACTQIQERAFTEVYFLLTFLISGFIYPIVLAWIKGDGWLKRFGFYESGLGSAVLLVGATSGFVMNIVIGPRYAMFYKQAKQKERKQRAAKLVKKVLKRGERTEAVEKRTSGNNTFYSASTKKESDEELPLKPKLTGHSSDNYNSQDEITKKKTSQFARMAAKE